MHNRDTINKAREQVSNSLKCNIEEIFFTSGGSESNNIAIKGVAIANKLKGNHIIISTIEHSSVLNTCRYLKEKEFNVTYLSVDSNGMISLEQLKNSITSKTILISIIFVNNEIATIQEIDKISKIAKEHNIYFHIDAVQAIGKIDINLNKFK